MNYCKPITGIATVLFSSIGCAQILEKEITPYSWTGFYAGLNAGIVKHTVNITDNQATSFLATIQQVSDGDFSGGFQVGYRRQLDMHPISAVYGLEFSANFADATFKEQYGSAFALYQLNAQNKLKNNYLLQAIGGLTAGKTWLFLAGGLSWSTLSGSMVNVNGIPFFNGFSWNKTVFGTAVGAGIEYAYNDKLSARIKVDVITPNTLLSYDNTGNNFRISNALAQGTLGVNYTF